MTPHGEQFRPGDIITAYHKGYHIVTRIEDRTESSTRTGTYKGTDSPLIWHKRFLDSNGKPSKSKELCSDAAWCNKLTKEKVNDVHEKEIQLFIDKRDRLLAALNEIR